MAGNRIGDVFWDDMSGASQRRPGWAAVSELLEQDSSYTGLLVWDLDRMSRSISFLKSADEVSELRIRGVTVVTPEQEFPAYASRIAALRDVGQLFVLMKKQRDGEKRVEIAREVIRGLSGNIREGYWGGGSPPYGFVRREYHVPTATLGMVLPRGKGVVGQGYKVVVMPGESPDDRARLDIVRRIHREYNTGVSGLATIAHRLSADGVAPPGAGTSRKGRPVSKRWDVSAIRMVLTNPLYMGTLAWARTSQGSVQRFDRSSVTGARDTGDHERRTLNGADDAIGLKAVHRRPTSWGIVNAPKVPFEPVVPPDIWWANIERLLERGELRGLGSKKGSTHSKYPLRVVCGDCGRPMIGTQRGSVPNYVCATYFHQKSGRSGKSCHHNVVPCNILHAFVFAKLREQIKRSKAKDRLRKAVKRLLERQEASHQQESQATPESQTAREADLKEQLESVAAQLHGPDAVKSSEAKRLLNARLREIDDELLQLKASAKAAKRQPTASPSSIEVQVERALALLDDLDVFVERLSRSHVAALFTAIGAEVVVEFDHTKQASRTVSRRRCGVLRFGQGSSFVLPVPVDGVSTDTADGNGTNNRAGTLRTAPTTQAAPNDRDRLLGKDGRGERI